MATEQTKGERNLSLYKKTLKEGREEYEKRKEFLKSFSLSPGKKKASTEGESGDTAETSEGGSVVLNGDMPTIAQYKGPDVYYDEIIKDNYQSGIIAKLTGTDKWNKDIKEQASKAGVNPLLIKVLMATESGGSHSPTPNPWNCVGLMQVQGATADALGLDWAKTKSDPIYNIYAGCMVMKEKHTYAATIIKGNGEKYAGFKSRGYELKQTCHGVAWLYNGFSVPSNGSSKVTTGGYIYANQIHAILKGFGRDAHKDTALTTDVLGSSKEEEPKKEKKKEEKKETASAKKPSGSGQAEITSLSFSAAATNRPALILGTPPREPLDEDELTYLSFRSQRYNVPIGRMKGIYYLPPKYDREKYTADRKTSKAFVLRENYAPLPQTDFLHLAGPQENYYAKEARELFLLLKNRLGKRQLVVSRGYEPASTAIESSHSLGIAMDIYVASAEEAVFVADTAWLLGIRAIAVGPNFVHVDSGPESIWGYDRIGIYRGPGTLRAGGVKNG